ncbi:hypothetical protein SADUNF_Sadunf18G0020800 [Salix dunnii]|uniref:Auxin-responsive protein n=1 Tax=Salix dunnii TaxID=1413687 RepID=A0A835J3G2_9ROSI|nr:hypothetical protein SADUNF_Sadunf18G0020800 [Salix dunnii]
MELQLGLPLPTYNFIENFDLNNDGFEPKDDMVGLKPWSCGDGCLDNKRSFEVAFGKNIKGGSQELPLLLWSGQPNDGDDWKGEKKIPCSINMNVEEENQVVGWPPLKSWRKKMLHHQNPGVHVLNRNYRMVTGNHENGTGSNTKYVKVKMEGVAITRKIDLRHCNSYQTLTNSLISMFAKCQKLEKDAAHFTLTYQDREGDWLIAGDVPWQTFTESVQRLEIVVFAQNVSDPNEGLHRFNISVPAWTVDALNKLIDHWNLRDKLNITNDPCIQNEEWANEQANPRVVCDCSSSTCHITHLKIYALDISGEIPSELFVLKELVNLDFGRNILNGTIPAEIERLSNMQNLRLGSNNFVGPLPPSLGKLTSLRELHVDSSGVSGPIPREFANLKSLQTFWASDNLFTGKLPDFFGALTELRNLRLQGTLLEGPIPSNFSALKKLEDLRIGDLKGEDSFLEFLLDQKNLTILVLRNCLLSGQIPGRLGNFSQLRELDLSFNKLKGQIPDSFQDLASLQYLYLGSNSLNGQLPANIIGPNLTAICLIQSHFWRFATKLYEGMLLELPLMQAIYRESFSVKCGGMNQISASGIEYEGDFESIGAASLYTSSENLWAVSNTGNFISNQNGQQYLTQTSSQITRTFDPELYKTARVSPSSLRYYGLGLENGRYSVELHFAEIRMDDSQSWKGLGRRLFDIYIQGEIVLKDFNIKNEAGGSKKALIKTFEANVTNTIMDIHFFWAGKGTCCIPYQETYGPLVSAIHVSQVSDGAGSSRRDKKRVGKLVGISAACVAGLVRPADCFPTRKNLSLHAKTRNRNWVPHSMPMGNRESDIVHHMLTTADGPGNNGDSRERTMYGDGLNGVSLLSK